MILPPTAQTLVDQLVQVLGLQTIRPECIEIHLDGQGIAQAVKPVLSFRRKTSFDVDKPILPGA